MAELQHFALPDLGEGLTEGEILRWLVAPGDRIRLNQPIVEVETAKAAVEVPSPYAGTVTALHHGEGETVDVGERIITVDTAPEGAAPTAPDGADQRAAAVVAAGAAANPKETSLAALADVAAAPAAPGIPAALVEHPPDDPAVEPGLIGGAAPGGRTSVLVGYGPRVTAARRRPRRTPLPDLDSPAGATDPPPARVSAAAVGEHAAALAAGRAAVLAKPPVRKLARDSGVDLGRVAGTGPGGTITRADVEAARAGGLAVGEQAVPDGAPAAGPGARARGEQRIRVTGVRKAMAAAMVDSAFTAPHVTIWTTTDMTPSMELVTRLRSRPEFAGLRVSPLLLVARALLVALRRHPMLNSSWDEQAQEIVVKDYVNLGIAAATPRGLVVPNIADADRLALPDLARALQSLAETAREGRTAPGDMVGGTITITNVGVLGMDTGTPLLNPGESAILCFGAVRPTPWVHEGEIAVRQVTNLALSFDHRHIDGRTGAGFLADIAALLADPGLFAVWA